MNTNVEELQLRLLAETIRGETLKEFAELGFGHVGGAMSVVELLATLYGGAMNINPADPQWADRDRYVMSKGHAGPALYATLAIKGYFPLDMLTTLNKGGTRLPSHCDMRKTPGVDMTTGSLGQGISTAIGLALGQKMDGKGAYTFLCMGDGELNEGQVWEGAQFAPFHQLTNLIAFVDCNGKQLDGTTKAVLDPLNLGGKFREFGWVVRELDGHDVCALYAAIMTAKASGDGPHMFILHTRKGNGCEFVEKLDANHHVAFEKEVMQREVDRVQANIDELKTQLTAVGGAPLC